MPKEKTKTIGERLKLIRNSNNYSTNKFAEILGISQSSFTKLENDQAEPRTRTILALYEKFDVDPLWLITGQSNAVIQSQTALKIGQLADTLPESIQTILLILLQRESLLETMLSEEKKIKNVDMAAEVTNK